MLVRFSRTTSLALLALSFAACDPEPTPLEDSGTDAGARDAGDPGFDAGPFDAGPDAGPMDAGPDAGPVDAGPPAPVPTLDFEPVTLAGSPALVTDFDFVPGTSDEIFLSTLDGQVLHLRLSGDTTTLIGSFQATIAMGDECGLITMAIDPDFQSNRLLYLGHCTSIQASRISRVTVPSGADYSAAWDSNQLIVQVEEPAAGAGYHNIGTIGFEPPTSEVPGGVLWVSFGDKTNAPNAGDTNLLNGKLLRIIPNRAEGAGGYNPAPGNPFIDGGGDPAVYAYGIRNSWRSMRDSHGRFWMGDVGNHETEELNMADAPGQNFAWPNFEGPCVVADCDGFTDPFRTYSHGNGDDIFFEDSELNPTVARTVWVGGEYTAASTDRYDGQLTGRFFWGDWYMGFVRMLEVAADGTVRAEGHVGHLEGPVRWREAPDGYLYVLTFGSVDVNDIQPGRLLRVVLD